MEKHQLYPIYTRYESNLNRDSDSNYTRYESNLNHCIDSNYTKIPLKDYQKTINEPQTETNVIIQKPCYSNTIDPTFKNLLNVAPGPTIIFMISYTTLILWNLVYAIVTCVSDMDPICDPARHGTIELSIIILVSLNIVSFAWSNLSSGVPDYNTESFNYDDIDRRSGINVFIMIYGIFSTIIATTPFVVILTTEEPNGLHFKDGSLMTLLMVTSFIHGFKQCIGTIIGYVWAQEYSRGKMMMRLSQ